MTALINMDGRMMLFRVLPIVLGLLVTLSIGSTSQADKVPLEQDIRCGTREHKWLPNRCTAQAQLPLGFICPDLRQAAIAYSKTLKKGTTPWDTLLETLFNEIDGLKANTSNHIADVSTVFAKHEFLIPPMSYFRAVRGLSYDVNTRTLSAYSRFTNIDPKNRDAFNTKMFNCGSWARSDLMPIFNVNEESPLSQFSIPLSQIANDQSWYLLTNPMFNILTFIEKNYAAKCPAPSATAE